MGANETIIKNNPLVALYCKANDGVFSKCPDKCIVRAIGNFSPKFPDEQLEIKVCNRDVGNCATQVAYFKLPTLPKFFFGNS